MCCWVKRKVQRHRRSFFTPLKEGRENGWKIQKVSSKCTNLFILYECIIAPIAPNGLSDHDRQDTAQFRAFEVITWKLDLRRQTLRGLFLFHYFTHSAFETMNFGNNCVNNKLLGSLRSNLCDLTCPITNICNRTAKQPINIKPSCH